MSTSSGTPESWISSFCSLLGHEYFAEVSEEFIEDDFNLTGLQTQVAMYKEALEMILDVEPEDDEDEDEEEEEEEDDNDSADQERLAARHERRQHSRMAQARTLPVGLSDIPGEDTVKLFCPSCLDVYVPPNSRFQTVDGAFFGRTFGALFLLTFPEYDLTKHTVEMLPPATGGARVADDGLHTINGMYSKNIGPGLGAGNIYEPKIYGFRVSELARSGPRMQWLRSRPGDMSELDEAKHYAEKHPDSDDGDERMEKTGSASRRRDPAAARPQRQTQTGSPMNVEANGVESEL
ncbi:Casein kinase II subunit beta-1 like protein [Verticillium longisporum]|uniref:Casein kinase II subunit beta n=1 Tax=Verticillium longisporum TaxID=100787 RepID=A0A8I2ZJQ1_VERLO|nr:Casein kinase II subunit beta-1 like protein [Verticillium longisporum]